MQNILLNILIVLFIAYLFSKLKTKYHEDSINSNDGLDYKKMFDNFREPILIVDEKNMIIQYNKEFLNTFDFNYNELQDKNLADIVQIKEPDKKTQYIVGKLDSGQSYEGEVFIEDNKGTQMEVELKFFPIKVDDKIFGKQLVVNKIDKEEKKLSCVLRESRRKIRDLHQTALKMENVRSDQEVYDLTVKAAENILDFDLCTLDIVEGDQMVVKATSSHIINGESISSPIDEKSIATYVYKEQQSLLTKDIQNEKYANPTSSKYHSALTIPIGDRGIFQAVSTKINEFTREDLELVELLIAHALSALQRLEMDKKIRYLGFHDSLTGLYNRHYLNEEIERLDTNRQLPISVIIGDLNGLKLVNDIFGHEEGDQFLKKAAEILKSCLRKEDILGRWGGDEFMIILPKTNCDEADEILYRINEEIQKTHQDERPISISLGRATKDLNYEEPFQKVIEEADYKMYKNKSIMHEADDNPLIEMIKNKMSEKKLNKGEVYRLDSLLNMFKNKSQEIE